MPRTERKFRILKLGAPAAVVLVTVLQLTGQTPSGPASQETGRFEVASVRQNNSNDTWQRQLLRQRGGAFRATGLPLRDRTEDLAITFGAAI